MRVSQQWAGSGFGTMFIPRLKNEVLVSFFEGDPDMPVVIGRAFNLTRPLPYKLPDHDRKTVWKTKTSPIQEDPPNAYNELRFDDTPEDELVYIQAQRDLQELVKNHEVERTGKSRVTVVGENRSAIVAKQDTYLIGEKYSVQVIEEPDKGKTKVEEKSELKLIDQKTPEVKPLSTKIEMIDQQILTTTGPATVVMKQGEITWNAKGGEISFKAGGNIIVFGGPDIKINS
jgi:type VI secretion system secreted protein VgrG